MVIGLEVMKRDINTVALNMTISIGLFKLSAILEKHFTPAKKNVKHTEIDRSALVLIILP